MNLSSSDTEVDLTSKEHLKHYIVFLSEISKLTSKVKQENIDELKELLESFKSKRGLAQKCSLSLDIWERILNHIFLLKIQENRFLFGSVSKILPLYEQLQMLSVEEFPRDHIVHALHVLCLGTSLINANPSLWEDRFRTRIMQLAKYIAQDEKLQSEMLNNYFRTNPHLILKIYAGWTLASLAHDLGYTVMELKEILKPHFAVFPIAEIEKKANEVVMRYRGFLSNLLGRGVELENCLCKDRHDYFGAIFLVPPWLNVWGKLLLLKNLDSLIYFETLFAIVFHDAPFLSAFSPMLQLLVIADTLEETERYVTHGRKPKLTGKLEKAILISRKGEEIKAILTFKKKIDAKKFFDKAKETFGLYEPIKDIFESDSFPQYYNKMGMVGLKVSVEICPPCDRFVLLFHEKCGRLSAIDKNVDLPQCQYCSSSSS